MHFSDLFTNADEADLRVWLHCKNSCGVHKLIYSPDTDVYHIGLYVLSEIPEHDVIVQLSKNTDNRARYLHKTNLVTARSKYGPRPLSDTHNHKATSTTY